MTIILKIVLVALGVGLSAWFALVAYDVGTDYRRFTRLRASRRDVAPAASPRARTTEPKLTAKERADGVV